MQSASTIHTNIEQALGYLSLIADMSAEKTNEGIAIADLNGSLLFLNEAWCVMHGYKSRDELIGKHLSLFHTKEQMKTNVIPLLEKTKQCGQVDDTVKHIKRNGKVFATRTKMFSMGDGTGMVTGFIIFAADILQPLKLKDTAVENLKQIRRLSERIAQLRKLFGKCRETGERLAEQTNELQANNEMLLIQINDLYRLAPIIKQNPENILPWKDRGPIINELWEDTNPEQRRRKEALAHNPKSSVKSKISHKPLNTRELRKIADLARRLSEFSEHDIRNEHTTDVVIELQ